jgi:hypothetical protein
VKRCLTRRAVGTHPALDESSPKPETIAHAKADWRNRRRIVNSGTVHLWGLVGSQEEHKALIALAEGVPGVVSVADEMIPAY